MENLVEIINLNKTYNQNATFFEKKQSPVCALSDLNLTIKKGEILALVGESGCGKSTLGNIILKLLEPSSGEILYNGENIFNFNKNEVKNYRKKAQMIFQNPYSSLNPKMKVYDILKEPLDIHKFDGNKQERIFETAQLCGLLKDDLEKYPHQFSGGQRQRVAIARSLMLRPEFIIADEPISALDVSIQATIINLLLDLKEKLNLTFLFISHDLNIVKYLSDNIAILNKGKIVEYGKTEDIFSNPKDEYTKLLLDSIPKIEI